MQGENINIQMYNRGLPSFDANDSVNLEVPTGQ
jgi:hypothetical protein